MSTMNPDIIKTKENSKIKQYLKVKSHEFFVGIGARLASTFLHFSSQRSSSVLLPSLGLVTVAHWSSRRILLYIVDRRER